MKKEENQKWFMLRVTADISREILLQKLHHYGIGGELMTGSALISRIVCDQRK